MKKIVVLSGAGISAESGISTFRDNGGLWDNYDDSRVKDVGFSPIDYGDVDERGVQYRPHIVFFGEAVPKIKDAIAELSEADYMIIVGTSLLVQQIEDNFISTVLHYITAIADWPER